MDPKFPGNLCIVFAISSAENDPTSQGDLLGCVMTSDQFLKTLAFFIGQFDFRRLWTRHSIHLCSQSWHTLPQFAPKVKPLAYLGPSALAPGVPSLQRPKLEPTRRCYKAAVPEAQLPMSGAPPPVQPDGKEPLLHGAVSGADPPTQYSGGV